jgi:hypothetical protein
MQQTSSGLLPFVVQMNAVSSRSHSLFVVTVMQAREADCS